jgi:cytosine deaminase
VLADSDGKVVAQGHNEVFAPRFRSDLHAEMVTMDHFEDANPTVSSMAGYTLTVSREPCPMCMTRLIHSGVGVVRYVAPDPQGGMVQRRDALPPLLIELSRRQTFTAAAVSPELAQWASDLFMLHSEKLNDKLKDRGPDAI